MRPRHVMLLRRFDVNKSGTIEPLDLQAAYDAYETNLITFKELNEVLDAWQSGERFVPRLVTPHLRDRVPTVAKAFKRLFA